MEELLITGVRFLGSLPMFVAVVYLVFKNRGKLQSAVYNRSRWLITTATLILGVQFAIQFVGQLREQSPTLCWTLNMMAFVIATPLYNMAELNLLRAGHNMKPRYRRGSIFITLCYVLLAIGYLTDTLINDQQPWMTMTFVVAFLYFAHVMELSWVLGKEIKRASTRLTGNELAERHKVLHYTARIMKWIILLSVFSPWVGMSPSLLLNAIYGCIIFPLLITFIIKFLVYGSNMAECILVDNEIAEAVMTEEENQNEQIRQRIDQWLSERHFIDPKVKIDAALAEMGISSTALNFYLEQNTTVQNYRKWLPYLRIEEAKRYMLAHPDYSLDAVAEACGYSDKSNFSRAFKDQEGMPPGQWLTKQKENI